MILRFFWSWYLWLPVFSLDWFKVYLLIRFHTFLVVSNCIELSWVRIEGQFVLCELLREGMLIHILQSTKRWSPFTSLYASRLTFKMCGSLVSDDEVNYKFLLFRVNPNNFILIFMGKRILFIHNPITSYKYRYEV